MIFYCFTSKKASKREKLPRPRALLASLCFICLLCVLCSCADNIPAWSGDEGQEANTAMSPLDDPAGTGKKLTALECLLAVADNFAHADRYVASSSGKVVALGGIYTQNVSDTRMKKGDEFYFSTLSSSSLVKVGKRGFIKGGEAVMNEAANVKKGEWSDGFTAMSMEEYLSVFGLDPRMLTNYLLNGETVLSSEFVSSDGENFTYRYLIDPEAGTPGYRIKTKAYGGFGELPFFSYCVLELTFDRDLLPVKMVFSDRYTVDLLGGLECEAVFSETFDFDSVPEIPDEEAFLRAVS